MNLRKKKLLAKRALNVGNARIIFLQSRLDEIKEAITKQDIKTLQKDGAIIIREIKGRRKIMKKKTKRGPGKRKKNVNTRKRDYIILTRKLRKHVADMKIKGIITKEEGTEIRKRIRNKVFRSKSHLKEHIGGLRK